jgi:hypothetical protein
VSLYAAQFETGAVMQEAWQRISATSLRSKIVKTWTRIYIGIPSESDANTLLTQEISAYSNVHEGSISLSPSGMWTCTISFKTATWIEPAKYMQG